MFATIVNSNKTLHFCITEATSQVSSSTIWKSHKRSHKPANILHKISDVSNIETVIIVYICLNLTMW